MAHAGTVQYRGPDCPPGILVNILWRLFLTGLVVPSVLGFSLMGRQARCAEVSQSEDDVAQAVEAFRLEAEIAFLRSAAKLLQSGPLPAGKEAAVAKLVVAASNQPALRDAIAGLLRANSQSLQEALTKTADRLTQGESGLVDKWRSVRGALKEAQAEIAADPTDPSLMGRVAQVFDVQNLAMLSGVLVALAGLLYVYCHSNRHTLRRRRAGQDSAPAMLALRVAGVSALVALLATAASFFLGERLSGVWPGSGSSSANAPEEPATGPGAPGASPLEELLQEKARAEAELADALARTKRQAADTQPPGRPDIAELWAELQPALLKLSVTLGVQRRVAEQLGQDLEQVRKMEQEQARAVQQAARQRWAMAWLRGLAGALVLVGLAVPGTLVLRSYRERQDRVWRTCPMCLKEGTLKYDRTAKVARCTYVFSESPYQACDFTFGPKYLDMVKLCFPMLGTPTSGKTHWLAMTYRQLSEGDYPGQVDFFALQSPMADEFKRVVQDILQQRMGTSPTNPQRMPFPLIFDFADRDPWGRSNILVNVFDFAGEVVARQTMRHPQRERALKGDGFLYFLDPLEPRETQVPALDGFLGDLRMVHDAMKGKPILAPVAICISKIDMMPTKEYAGPDGEVVHRFYEDLARIGWGLDPRSVLRRSRLVAALCDVIWPGWDLEKKLSGIRHMFFPLTPVGLDKPGEPDLSKRVIGPLGLSAPLLWLLQMNGYRVFR